MFQFCGQRSRARDAARSCGDGRLLTTTKDCRQTFGADLCGVRVGRCPQYRSCEDLLVVVGVDPSSVELNCGTDCSTVTRRGDRDGFQYRGGNREGWRPADTTGRRGYRGALTRMGIRG